ncbi:MAG: hypothetical protein BMS9Abin15_0544 [Gammaproteobacteria bacterium]|nr:MAG: hypothetical protein BMS9Abin15_0544 [Gammaproteobacteria bacterium]
MAQLRFPLMPASANLVSLICAQKNYADSGISTRLGNNQVRTPNDGEIRDPAWRPLDMARDNPEEPQRGIDYRKSYPTSDATVLYYWRASYWRRLVS